MTDSERRGLDIARVLLHRELDAGNGPEDEQGEKDLEAALAWIRQQQAIDKKRREKRGQYRRSRC
jgi:hypothetical protein